MNTDRGERGGTEAESVATFVSLNPGRDVQRVGTAAFLGEDVRKIHDPVWAVIGNLGDSQCYLGVPQKVAAVQAALSRRVAADDLPVRVIPPAFTLGVSDGQLNGTPNMRFSLVGRELVNDVADMHLVANSVAGLLAVVACDKPPVGTVAAVLENNTPAVILSDGPIRPGVDPETGAGSTWCRPSRWSTGRRGPCPVRAARLPRPGQLRGHVHLQHDADVHRGVGTGAAAYGVPAVGRPAPPGRVPRSDRRLPGGDDERGIRPRDIVTPASLRNALTVAIAMGGSTNVLLHSVEIARAAGLDLWENVLSQDEFNELSHRLPVLVNMRPFGLLPMVDVDAEGGLQVVVKELLDAAY